MLKMFGRKKGQKDTKTTGDTSSSTSTTTVHQSNGYTRTSQFSSEFHMRREQVSLALVNSSFRPAGRSIFDFDNSGNGHIEPQMDAVPFSTRVFAGAANSYAANRPTAYRSSFNTFENHPFRSTEPILRTDVVNQRPALMPNIAQAQSPLVTTNHSILPTYVHNTTKLGKALVINNVLFKKKSDERRGAKKDSQDLDRVLKQLGFEVEHRNDLTGQAILKRVKQFSQSNFNRHGISLVVIMSHGNNLVQNGDKVDAVPGGFTQISGIDHTPVLTDDIIDLFTMGSYHPSLKGKPKIFIFQCCRGDRDLLICHDGAPIRKQTKQYADVLIAFSTLPGYLSNRNPDTGTWYIQSLCAVVEKYQKIFHIEEMLKLVDDELASKHPRYTQTSTYECRGFKRCYLYQNS